MVVSAPCLGAGEGKHSLQVAEENLLCEIKKPQKKIGEIIEGSNLPVSD